MKNLILIDGRIQNIESIIACLETNTDHIIFDYFSDTYSSIKAKINQESYVNISITQHNHNGYFFHFLQNERQCILHSILHDDPFLNTWTDFIQFLSTMCPSAAAIDLLICEIWEQTEWVYVINKIKNRLSSLSSPIHFRASVDILTSPTGDYLMESETPMLNITSTYFTSQIKTYTYDIFVAYPDPPIINTIIPQDKAIQVYLMELDDGGIPITKFQYSLNGDAFVDAVGLTSPFTISGLVNGTQYIVRFKASNGAFTSYESDAWFPVIPYAEINEPIILQMTLTYPATLYMYDTNLGGINSSPQVVDIIFPPSAPEITAVAAGNEEAMVSFTQPSDGGAPVIAYLYSFDGTTFEYARDNTSPLLIQGLNNGTEYQVQLKADNGYVVSPASPYSATFIPYANVPSPVITSVTPGNKQMTVYFTQTTIGLTISNYEYSIDGGQTYHLANTTSSPIVVTDLSNGVAYSMTLKANTTSSLVSLPSNTAINIVPYTTPDTPIIKSIVADDGTIFIYFDTAVFNGGRPVIYFLYSLDGGTTFTSSSQTQLPIRITGLTNGTTYNVAIKSINAAGYSALSNVVSCRPATLPSAPQIVSVAVDSVNVTIEYQPSAYGGGNTIVKHQYSLNNSETYIDLPADATQFTLYGLAIADYSLKIRVVTDANTISYSLPEYFSTFGANVPGAPTITGINYYTNTKTAIIRFTAPPVDPPILRYLISVNDAAFEFAQYDNKDIIFNDMEYGTPYHFKIKSVNKYGASPVSNKSATLHPIGVPSCPFLYNIKCNYVDTYLYYTSPQSNGSGIIKFQYSINSGEWINVFDYASPIKIPALALNAYSNIQLRAVNLAGASFPSTRLIKPNIELPVLTRAPYLIPTINNATVFLNNHINSTVPITGIRYILWRDSVEDPPVDIAFFNSFVINDLSYNVLYKMKFCLITEFGVTEYSPISRQYVYNAELSSAPIIYTIYPYGEKASIFIIPPDYRGLKPIISYLYSYNGEPYIDSGIDDDHMPIVTDISVNTPYTVTVKSRNEVGISVMSRLYTFYSYSGVPDEPIFSVASLSSAYFSIKILAPAHDGGHPILGYRYSFNNINYYPILMDTSNFYLRNLTPNTEYILYVYAYNALGNGRPYKKKVKTAIDTKDFNPWLLRLKMQK